MRAKNFLHIFMHSRAPLYLRSVCVCVAGGGGGLRRSECVCVCASAHGKARPFMCL